MPINFTKLSRPNESRRPIDPIELFQTLRVSDPDVNDLWLAQGDALRQWHDNRARKDIAIGLNTGAGKTLVGLLAAQSLVNEVNGYVVYACSSIQLVEQTVRKAGGYGLNATSYIRGTFSNDFYRRGIAPCITTYQALFNGKSRFFREDIAAIVFDDAHTAEHLLREHFTLHIKRQQQPQLFSDVSKLFKDYFARIGREVGYAETVEQLNNGRVWFVPHFALHEQLAEIRRLLLGANLGDNMQTKFTWEHLKDHIDLCTLFVSSHDLALTPPVVPVGNLPYFRGTVRRIYLSATIPPKDGFLRTFSMVPEITIAPETTAGECERMIVIPALHSDCHDDVAAAKQIISGKKAVVLVPTYRRAEQWSDITIYQCAEDVDVSVEDFKDASDSRALVLVGRYDGVDLPGDTCRVMIIDDLASSLGPLERYFWEQLGLARILRSTIASRIVQSFGRISRGMGDYGVVILTGSRLKEWMLTPKNKEVLPSFLRFQLEAGIELSRHSSSISDFTDAVNQCLERDPEWLQYYQDRMDGYRNAEHLASDEDIAQIAETDVKFGHLLWSRDYISAAKSLEQSLNSTFKISASAGAWHALWLGYINELTGDKSKAQQLYQRAHAAVKNIPPYDLGHGIPLDDLPTQVSEVSGYLRGTFELWPDFLRRYDSDLSALDGTKDHAQVEEAMRALGDYLGLDSTRPDSEYGTGPDVLWLATGKSALSLELKTGKSGKGYYQKRDLGQLRDHKRWIIDHTEATNVLSVFVGPVLAASPEANPDPDIAVVELEEFKAISDRLRAALIDIQTRAVSSNIEQVVLEVFRQRNLLWPDLYKSVQAHSLRDLSAKG